SYYGYVTYESHTFSAILRDLPGAVTVNNYTLIETTGIRLEVVHPLGDPAGVWRVEARAGTTTIARAYELRSGPEPKMDMVCVAGTPTLVLQGLEPGRTVRVALMFTNPWEMVDFSNGTGGEKLETFDSWSVQTGDFGELLAPLNFFPRVEVNSGFFFVNEAGLPINLATGAIIQGNTFFEADMALAYCAGYADRQSAALSPIPVNMRLTGFFAEAREVYYTFEGQAQQVVSLQALALDENSDLDLKITVAAPDGTPLAENDDAGSLRGELRSLRDSYIDGLTLPEDGLYTIILTRQNETEFSAFGLMVMTDD
ncbi:MAG: hypothetical protein MUE40_19770, partial [Anaerolineae bacterium]|nr:hypothetical protein [Anaerolineae bacterium]